MAAQSTESYVPQIAQILDTILGRIDELKQIIVTRLPPEDEEEPQVYYDETDDDEGIVLHDDDEEEEDEQQGEPREEEHQEEEPQEEEKQEDKKEEEDDALPKLILSVLQLRAKEWLAVHDIADKLRESDLDYIEQQLQRYTAQGVLVYVNNRGQPKRWMFKQ